MKVFVYAKTNSRAATIKQFGSTIKLDKDIKKMEVNMLPITSLLPVYDGKNVESWAKANGCTPRLWEDADVKFKGLQAKAVGQQV